MRVVRGALYHAKQSGAEGLVAYEDHRVLDLSAQERIERLERQNRLSSVRALSAAINAKDAATHLHGRNVASLCAQVSRVLGLSEETIGRAETIALLHDVGILGCAESRDTERGVSAKGDCSDKPDHAALGRKILAASGLGDLLPIARAHYERWDGTGYPDGLKGEEIPVEARVLAVCDAYDTMTCDRPQRMALSRRQARAELQSLSGSQFDPGAVTTLFAVLDAGTSTAEATG
jgi:HD-GYP domain-containing protein (c-di-GMP phosphodiesterase class II)